MPTAYTSLLGLALPVTGELQGTWGTTVNDAITSLLDTAVAGTTTLSTDADVTLTTTTGASNQARQAIILWTANGSVTRNITAPAQSKTYVVINNSAGTQSIVIRGAGPTAGVTVLKGERVTVAWNGSDFVKVGGFGGSGTFNDVTITTGNLSFTGTAQRITGDMSNATQANRLAFQSSTTNGITVPNLIPNGTAVISGVNLFNASDVTNASQGQVLINSTELRFYADKTGTGTQLPMTFYTGGSEAMRIQTSRNVSIGSTADNGNLFVSGANARVRFANTAGTASTLLFGADSGSVFLGAETNAPIYFITNNTERVRIDTSGNVGVGTASPSSYGKFAVQGSSSTRVFYADSLAQPVARYDDNSYVSNGLTIRNTGLSGSNQGIGVLFQLGSGGTAVDSGAIQMRSEQDFSSAANQDAAMTFYTVLNGTNAERFRITSTGAITSVDLADAVGYKGTPINEQSAAYTLVLADQGKSVVHPITDNNARTFTIPANGTVAFPVGTTITFINMINTLTISITTDTMYLAGAGTTGSRTLAAYGMATAVKITSTSWIISGNGLT